MATVKKKATKKATAKRSGRVASEPRKAVTVLHKTPTWTTACPDWEDRIVRAEPLTPCAPLFPNEALEALDTYNQLYMCDQGSAGNYPTFGELSLPWTTDFVSAVFGCYCDVEGHPLWGRRLIKTFFMLISKKNGKSTLASGIMLTALLQNWRDEAEFIILSPTKEIADNSFKPIAAAIAADEELSALLQVQTHIRTITHRDTNATLKVVAADSQTVSGKKAVGILVDELHEFGKIAKAGQMLTEATGGLMSRPEGFVIYLTTQSSEPPAGVFKEKLEYARKVRDGKINDPTFYPIIYEYPDAMIQAEQHLLPANFYVTNPNMGASVDEPTLLQKIQEAKDTNKAALQDVLAKHLNVEVGMNLRSDAWPGAEFWEVQGTEPGLTIDDMIERCEVITVGIDGGGLDDLLGLTVLGRTTEKFRVWIPDYRDLDTGELIPAHFENVQKWLWWSRAYGHKSVLERRMEIAPRLLDFQNDGDLLIVEAMGQDARALAKIVGKIEKSGLLYMVGMDPNAVGGVIDALAAENVPEEKIKGVNQGYTLGAPIKTTERKLAEGVIVHAGRPMMAWCVGNAKITTKGNAIIVTKQISGTAKIDPLMAGFCAVALMEHNPAPQNNQYDFTLMELMG